LGGRGCADEGCGGCEGCGGRAVGVFVVVEGAESVPSCAGCWGVVQVLVH